MSPQSSSPLPRLARGATFAQVGIVVANLDLALHRHAGMGPWSIWTYDRSFLPTLTCAGQPVDCRFRIALDSGDPQLELIEPLDHRSPYAGWLARNGSGIHHLGYLVDDIGMAIAAMQKAGFDLIMSGSGYGADGTGGFAYFDTVAALGYVTEAIERPVRRREPEAIVF